MEYFSSFIFSSNSNKTCLMYFFKLNKALKKPFENRQLFWPLEVCDHLKRTTYQRTLIHDGQAEYLSINKMTLHETRTTIETKKVDDDPNRSHDFFLLVLKLHFFFTNVSVNILKKFVIIDNIFIISIYI